MIGGEIWLEKFLEFLIDEELENLMEEIQGELRKRRMRRMSLLESLT